MEMFRRRWGHVAPPIFLWMCILRWKILRSSLALWQVNMTPKATALGVARYCVQSLVIVATAAATAEPGSVADGSAVKCHFRKPEICFHAVPRGLHYKHPKRLPSFNCKHTAQLKAPHINCLCREQFPLSWQNIVSRTHKRQDETFQKSTRIGRNRK